MRRGFLLRGLLYRGLVCSTPLIAGARAGGAVEAPPPVVAAHLEVQAAPGCATRDELAARVAARSQRIRFVDHGAAPTGLRAEIAPGPNDTFIGRLDIVDPNGRRSSRRLSAASCAETIDALALIIVIALDPTYSPSPGGEPGRGTTSTPGADRVSVGETATIRSKGPPAGPSAGNRMPPPSESPPPRSSVLRRFGIGASAQLISGPAPRVMPGVAFRAFAAIDRASIWSPALRLTAAHAETSGIEETGGIASFSLDTLGLDVCPIRLGFEIVNLRGCAAGTAGRFAATGSFTYSPRSQARPFVGVGGSAIVGVAIGPHFELSGTFGAADALIRDAFEFSPQVFHRVSAMTLTVDLGLGLRFP